MPGVNAWESVLQNDYGSLDDQALFLVIKISTARNYKNAGYHIAINWIGNED